MMSELEITTNAEFEQLKSKKPNFIRRAHDWSSQYVNYKMGSLVGVVGGAIVYWINSEHGFWPAAGGAAKQFLYNVFVAGFNIKTCEKLAKNIQSGAAALTSSTLVPTAQAFAITYGIHKFGGTPEAYDSSIWQVYVNLPTFAAFGWAYRKNAQRTSAITDSISA